MSSSSSSSPEIAAALASEEGFSYKHASNAEVLEDLLSRFIYNLPDEELASLERICFQIEQAHWFYEDFIREVNPKFPSLPLKRFSAMLFAECPLLKHFAHDHEQAFNTFLQYKTRVPVCGAIMLNETWDKCLLVKGWKSSSGWGFPKGKINEDEPPATCAIREVLEETGYNLSGQLDPQNVIELSIRDQKIALYIVPGVPEQFPFKTKTRKEISKIEWFKLSELPTWKKNKPVSGKFYLISPFIGPLRAFINERRRGLPRKAQKANGKNRPRREQIAPAADGPQDVHQESSSQSSSADNCDPQTPPHAADATIQPGIQINKTDSITVMEGLDPHFARLLSSLASSDTQNESGNVQKNVTLAPPGSIGSQDDSSISAEAKEESTMEEGLVGGDKSKDMLKTVNPLVEQHWLKGADARQPLPRTIPSRPFSAQTHIKHVSPTNNGITYLPSIPDSPDSAKLKKQLSLLQSVADESAKLSPLLASNTRVGNMHHHPGLAASVPPQDISVYSRPLPDASRQAMGYRDGYIFDNPSIGHSQVRPQTSHNFRRPFPPQPVMAMNHSQHPSSLPYYPQHTSPYQHTMNPHIQPLPQHILPFVAPRPAQGQRSQFYPSIGVPPGISPVHQQAIPQSAPAYSPQFDLSPSRGPNADSGLLLSILNGTNNQAKIQATPHPQV